MNSLDRVIEERDLDFSKIMLTEFPRQTFKANQRLGQRRTERGDQFVQRRLPSWVARLAHATENFQGRQVGLLFQNRFHLLAEILHHIRPANPPFLPLGRIVDIHHRRFLGDPSHRAQPHAAQTSHLGLRMTRLKENLDFVTL